MDAQVDWQWLRTFAVVARTGSLSGAALELEVHHSTVSRQMVALEAALQVRLLERLPRGIGLTASGEALRGHVADMEARANAGVRAVVGQDVGLEGSVRFTTTDELLLVVAPILRSFLARYPGITLQLDTDSTLRDLTRREADVALRASRRPPDDAIARDLGPIRWGVYAREDAGPAWIDPRSAYSGDLPIPADGAIVPTHSVSAALQAIRAGLGHGPLPAMVGRAVPELGEIRILEEETPAHLWLLLHPDLRTTARVRALVEHLVYGLEAAERATASSTGSGSGTSSRAG